MVKRQPNETILMLIWIQALIATVGSLFYSEVMGYVPCDLCWIQRIFMYPLVIIYGIAALKKDLSVALSGVILSGIGLCVSVYHYGLQKLLLVLDAGGFGSSVSCNLLYVNYFGFITIPFLAGSAFLVILTLHIVVWRLMREVK